MIQFFEHLLELSKSKKIVILMSLKCLIDSFFWLQNLITKFIGWCLGEGNE